MKKITFFLVAFAFVANAMATDLFYTDFATTPADLAAKTLSTGSATYSFTTGQLPVTGTTWEFGGVNQVKFADNDAPILGLTSGTTIAAPTEVNTPIGAFGRISLNATGDYFKVKNMQGPFTVIVYVSTQTTDYANTTGKIMIGTTDYPFGFSALKLIEKKTFEYAGSDIVDVTLMATKNGSNAYDIKIVSGVATALENISSKNMAYMSGKTLQLTEAGDVTLYSLNGCKVVSATNCKSLSCTGIAKGIYFAKINTNGIQTAQKIVIE